MQSVHFDADQKLLDFIQRKADKLETFYDRIIDGEVFLRLEKDTENRQNKLVEIKLHVPGGSVFAKEHSGSFETATDEAVESLRVQLLKIKDKQKAI